MAAYALEDESWASLPITWSFAAFNLDEVAANAIVFSQPIVSSQYQTIVEQAFNRWASVANISFVQVAETALPSLATAADVRIGFADLNCSTTSIIGFTQYKFIGSSFYQDTLVALEDPAQLAVNAMLDYQIPGVSMYQIALHEIGHALGLAHSSDPLAVMNATATPGNGDLDATDIAGIQTIYGAPSGSNFIVTDTISGSTFLARGEAYTGPVSWLKNQFIVQDEVASISPENLNIRATSPNVFIHTGSGMDAIDVSEVNGNNVIDGSTGANYLVGGTGLDTFFVDDRQPSATWDTVVNFHANDQLTMWGINRAACVFLTADNYGAVNATGLTLFASSNGGKSWAAATLAGYTTDDLTNGRLTLADGFDTQTASHYLWIEGH